MRITRPKNWDFMTDKQREEWAVQAGKEITEAKKAFKDFIRQKEHEPNTTGE